jgi:hypothetical protein
MVVTQMQYGQWINDAPDGYEEVVQAELKAHLSVFEENMKYWLENELGLCGAPFLCTYFLTISSLYAFGKTSGFESVFA